MKNSRFSKFVFFLRTHVSDFITAAFSTWTFVCCYSLIIFIWIYLHKTGVINLDVDLTYCNFFLCWLSGIQASIVMISDGRREDKHYQETTKDLEVSEKTLVIDLKNKELIKKMTEKVNSMVNKIGKLESIIEEMENEEQELKEKINGKGNGRLRGKTKFHRES